MIRARDLVPNTNVVFKGQFCTVSSVKQTNPLQLGEDGCPRLAVSLQSGGSAVIVPVRATSRFSTDPEAINLPWKEPPFDNVEEKRNRYFGLPERETKARLQCCLRPKNPPRSPPSQVTTSLYPPNDSWDAESLNDHGGRFEDDEGLAGFIFGDHSSEVESLNDPASRYED
eukprot:c56707_g1_i1.p1 GENE.c56707_g1_i1~~c56707_g1_i1.p1  ORF type:complete len:171 (+),score=8.96 c56707_g1_i1:39-551(+)